MNLRTILSGFIMAALALGASALDLPVKTVRGHKYYYYTAGKGESLYGISKSLKITVEEILRHNPELASGLKRGDILVFPYEEYAGAADAPVAKPVTQQDVDIIMDTVPLQQAPVTPTVAPKAHEAVMAVLMPFGSEKSELSKTNRMALDFYKGVLVAADSMAAKSHKLRIVARDIDGLSPLEISNIIKKDSELRDANIILAPDDSHSLAAIAKAASTRTFILNCLNVRDSLYLSDSNVLQANIPAKRMYELAADGLMNRFKGYTPVILRNTSGKNEKESFIDHLKAEYAKIKLSPVEIDYKGRLSGSDLEVLPMSSGEKYVFIPTSGSLSDFNHFAHVLLNQREKLIAEYTRSITDDGIATANPAKIELFGYPDWTAFRGDAEDMLHRLNATVYSRFYDNTKSVSTREVNSEFKHWYGSDPMEGIPVTGLLGFDIMAYVIENLRLNFGTFDPSMRGTYEGVQSAFRFSRSGEGWANDALYIIKFDADGSLSSYVL